MCVADRNFLYSQFKIIVVFMSTLLLMANYFILHRPSWKLLLLFLKTGYQYLFCIKQANKICTLLSSHLLALKYNFRSNASVIRSGIFLRSPIQILTPPDRDKNFSELLYYKAVSCSECTLKLVVKRSCAGTWKWSTCQPRRQCFSIPFHFLQSFWVQYFASNHMSSQGTIYRRLLPLHYSDLQYLNTVRATYEAKTT